ncbi:MAG: carboxypeptidase regulatory-like domain-containing protein [Clostridia bacterium]|nr:carboxypeptidase regulatory-like domain-containing protein [Clostridia bacterium]
MESTQNTGWLIVNVSTARGAIPLPGAAVTVYRDSEEGGSVYTVTETDRSGKTDRMALPAPDRALSEAPGNAKPFATYTIQVDKEGYYTVTNTGVPIFSGVTSIQPVEMLPLAAADSQNLFPRLGLDNTERENPNL